MRERLHILQHALGLDQYGRRRRGSDRNHYVIGEGGDGHSECMAMVAEGLMTRRDPSDLTGGMDLFFATDAGRSWAQNNSPPPPRHSRDKARYVAYLESDTSLTFGAWLKRRHYAHA